MESLTETPTWGSKENYGHNICIMGNDKFDGGHDDSDEDDNHNDVGASTQAARCVLNLLLNMWQASEVVYFDQALNLVKKSDTTLHENECNGWKLWLNLTFICEK